MVVVVVLLLTGLTGVDLVEMVAVGWLCCISAGKRRERGGKNHQRVAGISSHRSMRRTGTPVGSAGLPRTARLHWQ